MNAPDPLSKFGKYRDLDPLARDAWTKMQRGVSLKECAYHARLHVSELDLIIWRWRGRAVKAETGATGSPLALRRFSWQ